MNQLELALHDPASPERMRDDLAKHNQTAFMEAQVVYGSWVECELQFGEIVYVEDDYFDGSDDAVIKNRPMIGWGCRFSAPGYIDCSDWSVFDTEAEAIECLWNQIELDEEEDAS